MTTRRRFLQTMAVLPPAYSLRKALAATPDSSRQALIIGNTAYRQAPLSNPENDARGMTKLLTDAGLSCDTRINATRTELLAAIERFGKAVRQSDTKLAVFYYAGHGVQLDWRNYLLPVDAVVDTNEHIKSRCVDLGVLLGHFSATKDKTFIVILDACRNNPFGDAWRPGQKGLSQFDAPPGSLLAYATAPGNVAADGSGSNGLYTEHLLRELSVRDTRIEDALKRVRLNVRLASHGEQIPWETTSLESDVFIFNGERKKLGEAELEKQLEADITEWTRIKSSKNADDWVSYLRNFPNGRFAEIAQMRLARLLAEVEKRAVEERQKEEQKRAEQERHEREQRRLAEEQRMAAEARKQREEQARLEREQARLAEERRQAAERKQRTEQEREQARLAEQQRVAAEQKQREEKERLERERARLAEEQRLAGERRQREQLEEARQREEQQRAEAKRLDLEKQAQAKQAVPVTPPATPATVASPKPALPATPASGSPLDIRAGLPVPQLIPPSANPFSAGRYPLGRIFTVGDEATVRQTDLLTGIEENVRSARVTSVDYENDRVIFNDGLLIADLMGNGIKTGPITFDTPVQFVPAEFQVGKKWTAAFRRTQNGQTTNAYYDLHIIKRETITVPAGSFDTFRIEGEGWNMSVGAKLEVKFWLTPGINFTIKREFMTRNKFGRFGQTERHELVSMRQHAVGLLI